MPYDALILFWVVVLAVAILVYGVLDGFDLGVGMLFGLAPEEDRASMMSTIAPSWDGNETWLVLIGTIMFGAFSQTYAILLAAFYIPVLLMLVGLIFRGVAFEFRGHAGPRMRATWDLGFWMGSCIVSFVQGAAVGTMIQGIPVASGQFAGGSFVWLKPFPILCGIGLMSGYAVLGCCWLLMRGPEPILGRAGKWGQAATLAMAALVPVSAVLALRIRPEAWENLASRPWAFAAAAVWVIAVAGLLAGLRRGRRSGLPFLLAALSFMAAFVVLAACFWPWIIPGALTIADAISPEASLSFMFWGAGLFALPVIALYTIIVYRVFRTGPVAGYPAGG